jgi:hypothetical protein
MLNRQLVAQKVENANHRSAVPLSFSTPERLMVAKTCRSDEFQNLHIVVWWPSNVNGRYQNSFVRISHANIT